MSQEQTKTIVRLSSTGLSSSNCIRKFHYTVIDGYKQPDNYKAVYGVAIHKFIDMMYKTGDQVQALMAARKAFNIPKLSDGKSPHMMEEKHMISVCFLIWSEYIEQDKTFEVLSIDGKPTTEQKFSIKIYEDELCVILMEGTIDTVGKFVQGCYAIRDFKTTSFWDASKFMQAYELSCQLRFYRLACKIMSEREPESVMGKIGSQRMGSFIDAIFVAPNCNETKVVRGEVFQYNEQEVEEFRKTIDDYCLEIAKAIRTGYLPKQGITNKTCQTLYGFCPFWNVCRVDDRVAQVLLNRDFTKVPFTPLNYGGMEE